MIDLVKENYSFHDLVQIMQALRAENGCAWDREQTHESIRRNMLEEAYEACEAIDIGDSELLREELGDVLLQVVFHSCIASENGGFGIGDVLNGICRKLVSRHPHVFGGTRAENAEQALDSWNSAKLLEKRSKSYSDEINRVAKSLPALMYAEEVQKKAKKAGFDWPDKRGALDKLAEEVRELAEAAEVGGNIEEELGDLLFSIVNVSRFVHIDAERALILASRKFAHRFAAVEKAAGNKLDGMSLEQMDELWDKAKLAEKGPEHN